MKAKLIKYKQEMFTNHILKNENSDTIATTEYPFRTETEFLANSKGITLQRLSPKNCQAIEDGYDLDELARESSREYLIKPIESPIFTFGYEEGFQKALEILGDKKFSEEDVNEFIDYIIREKHKQEGVGTGLSNKELTSANIGVYRVFQEKDIREIYWKEYIQSLQQTEWDVEIEMEDTFESNQGLSHTEFVKCRVLRIEGDDVYGEYIEGTKTNLNIPFSLSALNEIEGNSVGKPKLDENGCLILKKI